VFQKKDPQRSLFAASMLLPDDKRERLEADWPGAFRRAALPLIDEELFRDLYCADNGRPNKPVQTIVGMLLLKEMQDLTDVEAVAALDYDLRWQVALDLDPAEAHVCQKTLHNFRVKLLENDHARLLFERTAVQIMAVLGTCSARQRLDSTHIRSNMAVLTRLGLFCETMRVFLKALKDSDPARYASVPPGLAGRYLREDGTAGRYADARSSEGRRRLAVCARDVWRLADRFRGSDSVEAMDSYALLLRLLEEQCELTDSPVPSAEGDADLEDVPVPVRLKAAKAVGSDSLQSPHDADATYSAHKGKGYEVQLAETHGNADRPEVITAMSVTRSCDSDESATVPIVEDLHAREIGPDEMVADTNYGSTENVLDCEALGTALISPVAGAKVGASDEEAIDEGDFEVSAKAAAPTRCPRGRAACSETRTAGKAKTVKIVATFPASACADCPHRTSCPTRRQADGSRVLRTTLHAVTLARRRKYERSKSFRKRYAMRAGIEATNSELKRAHGLGNLRVRGFLRVRLAVILKVLACNVKRMIRHLVSASKAAAKAVRTPFSAESARPFVVGGREIVSRLSGSPRVWIPVFAQAA
jgi:hypothetical protein